MINFHIKEFISKQELKEINEFLSQLEFDPRFCSRRANRKAITFNDGFFDQILSSRFNEIFGKHWKVTGFTCTQWIDNVEVHTDAWQGYNDESNLELGYSCLIPLEVNPNNAETHTIIFDQWAEGRSVTLEKFDEDADWNISDYVGDTPDRMRDLVPNGLSKSEWEKYLSHAPYELIKDFTIRAIYQWNPGDAIIWHRSLFHTTSAFTDKIKNKMHLIALLDFEK